LDNNIICTQATTIISTNLIQISLGHPTD